MPEYNKSLADIAIPERIARLPISPTGYPTPWFVFWHDEQGRRCDDGTGTPDFRVIGPGKLMLAVKRKLCWICGQKLGAHLAFVIGPMCSVNRVSAEPPLHRECAEFSVRACPFLAKPRMRRNYEDMPVNMVEPGGFMIQHNPGATAIWMTKSFEPFRSRGGHDGVLCRIGPPEEILWFAEGRAATREEVESAFEKGLPILRDAAKKQKCMTETERDIIHARRNYLPPLEPVLREASQ